MTEVQPQPPETDDVTRPGSDVFISYAREDRGFVEHLHRALAESGQQAWVDWEGIPASARWMAEVRAAIDAADAFCFVISPDSVESPVCREEAAHAESAGKRIIPLLLRAVDDGLIPESVSVLNWVDFSDPTDFEQARATLAQALSTDLDHARSHTRLLVRAKEWEGASRIRSKLLRGADLKEAEGWLAGAEGKQPRPAAIQTTYVLASRKAAAARQRIGIVAVAAVLVLSLVLTSVALVQRNAAQRSEVRAEEQRTLAEERASESRSRELAALSLLQDPLDPELALLLGIEAAEEAPTGTAATALRTALQASHVAATLAEPGVPTALALSADGSTLAVGGHVGSNEVLRPWLTITSTDELGSDRSVEGMADQGGQVTDLAIDPSGSLLAASTDDGYVVIVDVPGAAVVRRVFLPSVLRHAEVAFDPAGDRLLVAGEDGVAWVDARTWRIGDRLRVPSTGSAWGDLAIDPTGRYAAVGGKDGIYLIDLKRGEAAVRLTRSAVSSVSFDGTGTRLGAASRGTAVLWSTATGRRTGRIEVPGVTSVSFSRDGTALLTGGSDGAAAIWNLETGQQIAALSGNRNAITDAAFAPSGDVAYTTGKDGSTRVWRAPPETVPLTTDPVLGLSRAGEVMATDSDGTLTFRDGRDGAVLSSAASEELLAAAGCADPSTISPLKLDLVDEGSVAVALMGAGCALGLDVSNGGPVWVSDPGEGSQVTPLPDQGIWASPDGNSILMSLGVFSGARVAEARLIEGGGGDVVWHEVTGSTPVYEADFSEDGQRVFMAGRFGLTGAAVYGVHDGKSLCTVTTRGRVNDVKAVPAGGFALATSAGVQVVDDECAAADVGELGGSGAPVRAIAYRDDGLAMVTIGADGVIRFWDPVTGIQLGSALGGGDHVSFTDDGAVLVGGSDGSRRYACDVCGTIDELLALAHERVTRDLSPEEAAAYLGE